jgi:hypothetical protein
MKSNIRKIEIKMKTWITMIFAVLISGVGLTTEPSQRQFRQRVLNFHCRKFSLSRWRLRAETMFLLGRMRFRLFIAVIILIVLVHDSVAQMGAVYNYVFDCQTMWERSEDQARTYSMLLIVKLWSDKATADAVIMDFIVMPHFTNGVSVITTEQLKKKVNILPKKDAKGWSRNATNPANPAYVIFGILLENPPGNFSYNEGYYAANDPQQSEIILKSGCKLLTTQ